MNYFCLLNILLLCIQAHASLTFSDRVTKLLKAKCRKHADETVYSEVKLAFDHLVNEYFPFNIELYGKPEQEVANYCNEHSEKVISGLRNFGDKLEPCLEAKEMYLKEFMVDVYNTSTEFLCTFMQNLAISNELVENLEKCFKTLEDNPNFNPSTVCFDESTIIGDEADFDNTITKYEICSDIIQRGFCFADQNVHCHADLSIFQRRFITAGIENCVSTLFRGTSVAPINYSMLTESTPRQFSH